MTFEEHLVPWRVTPQAIHEWCAWQLEHHPKVALACQAVLRRIYTTVPPSTSATHDAQEASCS